MDQDNNTKDETLTLKEFIDEHQKIISVIGVFTALAIFWSNSPLKEVGSFAAFWCLLATVPMYIQIWTAPKTKKYSWLLLIFLNLLFPLIINTVWYVLLAFRPQWQQYMYQIFLWPFVFIIWFLYRKSEIRDYLRHKLLKSSSDTELAEFENLIIDAVAVILIFISCDFIAKFPANYVNKKLDVVMENISPNKSSSPQPTASPALSPDTLPATTSPTPSTQGQSK